MRCTARGLTFVRAASSLLVVASSALASDWYVDDDGSTTGDGSIANPFKTVNAALAVATDGDRIHIAAGDYKEHLDVAADVALLGDPAGGTVIESPPLPRALAIASSADVWLTHLTIANSGVLNDFGGGMLNEGNAVAYRCRFTNCWARAWSPFLGFPPLPSGGGAISNAGTLLLDECIVDRCSVSFSDPFPLYHHVGSGGGIYNTGTLKLFGCTVNENVCGEAYDNDDRWFGGGVFNSGTLHLRNSTMTGNLVQGAAVYGGGIETIGTALVEFSTITLNRAISYSQELDRGAHGGGIDGDARVCHSIFALNLADTIYLDPGEGDDFDGTCDSRGYVLIMSTDDTTIIGDMTGVQTHVDPLLDVLADNGGFVRTHALLAGSPCIDAGTPDPLASAVTDARGFPRALWDPSLGNADLGAFESGGVPRFLFTASPRVPLPPGAVVALMTGGGIDAHLLVTAVVDVSGTSTFLPVIVGPFNQAGVSYVEADVPVGLSGMTATLRSFSLDANARLIVSNADTLTFQ